MFRFLALNAFIAVYSIIFCLWGLLVGLFDKDGRLVHTRTAIPWAKGVLSVCGIRVKVRLDRELDPTLPRIYMTNHQSYFDIFALLAHLPVSFKFILKQELMGIPLLGAAMRKAGYIGIDRTNPREAIKSINHAVRVLNSGDSVVIFPEGTRSEDGRIQPFKPGGFKLALKSGSDIVPVGIRGSHLIVPKGSLKIRKGTFSMSVGSPIPVVGYGSKDIPALMERVREAIEKQIKEAA